METQDIVLPQEAVHERPIPVQLLEAAAGGKEWIN